MHLLIPYVHLPHHHDPLLEEFTYGNSQNAARKLKRDLEEGDYIFFHTTIGGKKCITAYYVVDRVWDTGRAAESRNIVARYKNPHIQEFLSGIRTAKDEDVVVLGDPIMSRVLSRPLSFDRVLAKKLSLNIKFPDGKTEAQVIGSAARAWRRRDRSEFGKTPNRGASHGETNLEQLPYGATMSVDRLNHSPVGKPEKRYQRSNGHEKTDG